MSGSEEKPPPWPASSGGEGVAEPPSPSTSPPVRGGNAAAAPAASPAQDPHNNGARAALTNEIRSEFFRLYEDSGFQIPGLSAQNILRHKDKDLYFEGHGGLRDFWKQTAASRREILQLAREGKIKVLRGPLQSPQVGSSQPPSQTSTEDSAGTTGEVNRNLGAGSGASSIVPALDSRKRNHHADSLTDPPSSKRQQHHQQQPLLTDGCSSLSVFTHNQRQTTPPAVIDEPTFWGDRNMLPSHHEQQRHQQPRHLQPHHQQSSHSNASAHQHQPPISPSASPLSPAANPTAIATLLADLQAAFQEYDINLPANHAMEKLKDERDRALERALQMERERDDALRSRDVALKLAEESYGELRALMNSRGRRIQELRDVCSGSGGGGNSDRDRGDMMSGTGNGEWE